MTSNERQFEDFIRGIEFDDTPDPAHRDRLEQSLLRTLSKQSPWQMDFWRTIMKAKITKLAAAAVIIVAAALSVSILTNLTSPAWAIDETIEAMQKFNGAHVQGISYEQNISGDSFTLWARANEDHNKPCEFRLEGNVVTKVVKQDMTYNYNYDENVVTIRHWQVAQLDPWMHADFFGNAREHADKWDVLCGRDPETGRERIFLTCAFEKYDRSLWIEFDAETKLLTRLKQWNNTNFSGAPAFCFEKIVYFEELPDELFEFEIPEGATVIEEED
ncbi:MAG: hypothetical protein JSV99_09195 [Planctomycetota bacterium]|nr:MAG: hypothetical protein JSV99_09195 [Planctomycetota bacterium]